MTIDELESIGVSRMTDDEIREFLSIQRTGVLAIPDADSPYVLPLSFGYDGDRRLFFTFVLGETSRKATLAEQADTASFLAYDAGLPFVWESVLLAGELTELAESEREAVQEHLADTWHPQAFRQVELSGGTAIYEFSISEQTGIRHSGLPPEFEPDVSEEGA